MGIREGDLPEGWNQKVRKSSRTRSAIKDSVHAYPREFWHSPSSGEHCVREHHDLLPTSAALQGIHCWPRALRPTGI